MRFPNFAGPDRFLMQPRGFHGECHGVSCAHCFALTGWEGWEFGGFARIFHEETVVQVGKIFASSIYSYRAKFTSCQIKTPARGCIILKGLIALFTHFTPTKIQNLPSGKGFLHMGG